MLYRFVLKDGLIYREYAPGYFLWMLPGEARSWRDNSNLLRPAERENLAAVISEYEQLEAKMVA